MKDITQAITILNQGGIIIFPTDTAFGIGCRMDDADAIRRLFTLRKRPEVQATPVLVSSIAMAQEYVLPISQEVEKKLMKQYWPGALTIILPCHISKVPGLVRGGGETLGVRMPNHPITLKIIQSVGVPILAPSANFHGKKTPFVFEDLDQDLIQNVDFVVNGDCHGKQVSTVIDCSTKPWKILRQGAVQMSLS
jgi:L-threonylcarbamoyladenylate synthase